MDLGAYEQIEKIEAIAKANGIEVPRLRGYRLMFEENHVSSDVIEKIASDFEFEVLDRGVCSIPRFYPNSYISDFSPVTMQMRKKYLIIENVTELDSDGEEYSYKRISGFRWNLVHGKRRKAMKFAVKKARKSVLKQYEAFNKYAGRNDVLYIHARIGGPNWSRYNGAELARKPWFLEKVDDYFDNTYCDIYAKIDPTIVCETEKSRISI